MLISPTAAVRAAERGLREIDFDRNPDVAAALAAGHAGIPLLVTRLDQPDHNYYLVPWQDQRGVAIVIQVDASTGEMLSATVLPAPTPRIVMTPDEARRVVETQLKQRVTGKPKLVWRPSHESASQLRPFYQVAVEGGDVFVGVEGSVYRSLTPFGKGG